MAVADMMYAAFVEFTGSSAFCFLVSCEYTAVFESRLLSSRACKTELTCSRAYPTCELGTSITNIHFLYGTQLNGHSELGLKN